MHCAVAAHQARRGGDAGLLKFKCPHPGSPDSCCCATHRHAVSHTPPCARTHARTQHHPSPTQCKNERGTARCGRRGTSAPGGGAAQPNRRGRAKRTQVRTGAWATPQQTRPRCAATAPQPAAVTHSAAVSHNRERHSFRQARMEGVGSKTREAWE